MYRQVFAVQTGKLTFRPCKHPVLCKQPSFYKTRAQGQAVGEDTSFSQAHKTLLIPN